MCLLFFNFWTILHNLALIYTFSYVPKIGAKIGQFQNVGFFSVDILYLVYRCVEWCRLVLSYYHYIEIPLCKGSLTRSVIVHNRTKYSIKLGGKFQIKTQITFKSLEYEGQRVDISQHRVFAELPYSHSEPQLVLHCLVKIHGGWNFSRAQAALYCPWNGQSSTGVTNILKIRVRTNVMLTNNIYWYMWAPIVVIYATSGYGRLCKWELVYE